MIPIFVNRAEDELGILAVGLDPIKWRIFQLVCEYTTRLNFRFNLNYRVFWHQLSIQMFPRQWRFSHSVNNIIFTDSYLSTTGGAEHSEKHFFNLETRMRISPIQSRTSRRDENLWHLISGFETRPRKMSFNLRHRDEIEIYYLQSQTSRRERESKLRQFSREFTRIWFVACVWTDIF